MRVRTALGQQGAECCDVERVVAGGGELHAVAAGEQERGVALAQQPAQIGQRHAQIAAGGVLRRLGPEQAEQGIAAVAVALLDRQVGQQARCLRDRNATAPPSARVICGGPSSASVSAGIGDFLDD